MKKPKKEHDDIYDVNTENAIMLNFNGNDKKYIKFMNDIANIPSF